MTDPARVELVARAWCHSLQIDADFAMFNGTPRSTLPTWEHLKAHAQAVIRALDAHDATPQSSAPSAPEADA